VGQTYNYTVSASTATQGYEQLEAFLDLSNIVFRSSRSPTYPLQGDQRWFYADACGWDNNPSVRIIRLHSPPNYSEQSGRLSPHTVKVLSSGTTTAGTLVWFFR
jgi:hypothetical protein